MNPESTRSTTVAVQDIPIDWEALEDAFENNAHGVHSYLHRFTGTILRVVDGVADPQTVARLAVDPTYLRIDPVSSHAQYRWIEQFIPTVEPPLLRRKLSLAVVGKGAFRRFKDLLMAHTPERERWFAFRSKHLRSLMEAWLHSHALNPVARTDRQPTVVSHHEAAAPSGRRASVEPRRQQLWETVDTLDDDDLDVLVDFAEFIHARSRGER